MAAGLDCCPALTEGGSLNLLSTEHQLGHRPNFLSRKYILTTLSIDRHPTVAEGIRETSPSGLTRLVRIVSPHPARSVYYDQLEEHD